MNGVVVLTDWITPDEETQLIKRCGEALTGAVQNGGQGRSRVVRFGYAYDEVKWIGDIPTWLDPIRERLKPDTFNSVTINEYHRGTTIHPHIDSLSFGEPIAVLSMITGSMMVFSEPDNHKKIVDEAILPARSLLLLSGDARYNYAHTLRPVKGEKLSIVFRRKILS